MSIPVTIKASLNREYLPLDKKSIVYISFDVICGEGIQRKDVLPSAITIIIDRSGSMRGKKLEQAKLAAERLIDQLQPGDYLSFITFSSKAEEMIPLEKIQNIDIADFKKKLFKIKCGGGTELFKALETAHNQYEQTGMTSPQLVKRIILLSDGQPTDHMPESLFKRLATDLGEAGISVTAMGLGKEYNEDLLSDIAERSHGVWKHISKPEDMPAIFKEQLDETRVVVRTNADLIIKLNQSMELKNIYKAMPDVYEIGDIDFTSSEIRIPHGDIRIGEIKTYAAKLNIPQMQEGRQLLATAVITNEPSSQIEIYATFTGDVILLQQENDAFPRGLFFAAETQLLTKKGLSGDSTSLHQAKTQAATMMRDKNLTNVQTIQHIAARIDETIARAEKGMDSDETKSAKQSMTHIGRRE